MKFRQLINKLLKEQDVMIALPSSNWHAKHFHKGTKVSLEKKIEFQEDSNHAISCAGYDPHNDYESIEWAGGYDTLAAQVSRSRHVKVSKIKNPEIIKKDGYTVVIVRDY